jgi:succinoglycan biosynthesis protein ExoU
MGSAMASPPDVCVIIPAFNAVRTIGRAVRSALDQPEAAEVIVVDDGSTDATSRAAQEADDGSGRLRILVQPVSGGGPAAARNRAIEESTSPWICPLDADDYFLDGRLAALRAQAGNCDFIADDLLRATEHQPDGPYSLMIRRGMAPTMLDFATFVRGNISRPDRPRSELGFLKPLMRRAFLDRAELRYDPQLRLGEDFVLYARALADGARFKLVPACGYIAVERANSLSGQHSGRDLQNLLAATRALEAMPLTFRERTAVRAHRQHVAAKVKLREVIDVRRAHGYVAAALVMAPAPHLAPYVMARTVSAMRERGQLRRLARYMARPARTPPVALRSVHIG